MKDSSSTQRTSSSTKAAGTEAISTEAISAEAGSTVASIAAAEPAVATPAPGIGAIAAAEQAGNYRNFGPAYVGTGVAGDVSVEIGIATGKGEMQQRSGVGFYLRSDHMAHRYASQLLI